MSTAEAYNGAGGRRDPGVIGRMWAMIVKEFVQMRRDRMTFATMLFVPILQLVLFGYGINTGPKQLPAAVLTRDRVRVVYLKNPAPAKVLQPTSKALPQPPSFSVSVFRLFMV